MLILEKKYKDYMSQEYEPVDESLMPYLVDIRAIKAYADSKGVAIADLSDEEKQRFMIPNPNYRKKRRHSIAAMFCAFYFFTVTALQMLVPCLSSFCDIVLRYYD